MMVAEKRLIQATDLFDMVTVENPQISPDGQWVAFVRVGRDEHQNKTKCSIWLVRPDGRDLRQFTSGAASDSEPRWSHDGSKLAFVSERGGKPQIYVMPHDGGEALPLTYMLNGATTPAWSPDGSHISFLSRLNFAESAAEDEQETLPPAALAEMEEANKEAGKDADERFDPRVVDKVPFRTGTKFWDERFTHIYVVAAAGGCPQRLTAGDQDYQAPVWTADGDAVYSGTSRQPDHDMARLFNMVIRIAVADGRVEELTAADWACDSVKLSPDGQWIAFLTRPATLPLNRLPQLAIMPAAGGEMRILAEALDRTIELFAWAADSQGIVFTARDGGSVPVFIVPVAGGELVKVGHEEDTVIGLDAGAGNLVAAAAFTTAGRGELFVRADAGTPNQVTDFNSVFLDTVQVGTVEHMPYVAPDGTALDGWIVYPPDMVAGEQYPLALNMHGGPAAMWGPSTPSMWIEWQHHAANGYIVFFCNPRGSTGYGEAFMLANHPDWGDGPMRDVLTGVDLLIERGQVDSDRLAITGGSYGGYLTAWIIGHDDRFAAAVAQRGVYHLQAFHGVTDIPLFMTSNMQTEPWDNPDVFWKYSPLAYARSIVTPLLIIHSENDFRVPIAEGEQLFTTLKRLNRTVQMVRYPREGHELSRSGEPKHMVDRLERILGWWDRYCRPEEASEK
ncbi:S9 family peptidase [Chloroflexota bacterium]